MVYSNNIMKTTATTERETRYTEIVCIALEHLKHATNDQILDIARQVYPEVSITTIHRVTERLKERGVIKSAPNTADKSERFDVRADDHHYFMCTNCSRLCNVPNNTEVQKAIETLKAFSNSCQVASIATLQGLCHGCSKLVSG